MLQEFGVLGSAFPRPHSPGALMDGWRSHRLLTLRKITDATLDSVSCTSIPPTSLLSEPLSWHKVGPLPTPTTCLTQASSICYSCHCHSSLFVQSHISNLMTTPRDQLIIAKN